MNNYNPKKIEKKWQEYWEKNKINSCNLNDNKKTKFYNLVMFYYPSGDKIHVGHGYNYTGSDVFGRYKRMKGFNVFEPMGADAFGLPAENYAIRTGVHPSISTKKNIDFGQKQLKKLGLMYDWEKEINTSSPEYYKWTQWLFQILYKSGLAYQAEAPVNWCPSCKTVLANEQVIDGKCERCNSGVIQKNLKQWFFRITKYADKLLEGHKEINWPEKTIIMQKNWIGRSEGAEINFKIKDSNEKLKVFTTRADTLFGVTALVLAPEHKLILKLKEEVSNRKEVENYIKKSKKKSEIERTELEKEKTGTLLKGIYAINPVNNENIPVWIGDYVIASYGGGAVMVVPAHDKRDYQFAKKHNIEIREVVKGGDISKEAFMGYGTLCNSGQFSGLGSKKAIKEIIKWIEKRRLGKESINYRLRDWLISRQRYWGAPIPIIYCDKCGKVLVPEKDLPVKLPNLKNFKPTAEGESPLARAKEWVNVKCPKCGRNAKRSTETMDTFVCSSWYFLRYLSPHLNSRAFNRKLADRWLPVDQYNGGAEHACMHLLYARFITKVLYDKKFINFNEPFTKLNHQGMILAADGSKMSKSKGNVVIPDNYVKKYGADTFRVYVLFIASFEEGGLWNDKGIIGAYKFLKKVWFLFQDKKKFSGKTNQKLIYKLHYTIKKVGDDIENFKFNTAIAAMMEFINLWQKENNTLAKKDAEIFLKILAPFTPHICEELFQKIQKTKKLGAVRQRKKDKKETIFKEKWPEHNKELIKKETFELVIQVNGKVRDKLEVDSNISEEEIREIALKREKIEKWLGIKKPRKVIFIKGRLVNIVI